MIVPKEKLQQLSERTQAQNKFYADSALRKTIEFSQLQQ
jgi:hypothetical protein